MTDFGTISQAVRHAVTSALTERTSHPVTPESRLVEDLDLDSLDIADLIVDLETRFEFTTEYSPEKMQTVHDVMTFVEHLLTEELAAVVTKAKANPNE